MSALLRPNQFNPVSRELTSGILVTREATALVQNTGTNLFTVTGGGIILSALVGVVSAAVANTASLTAQIQHTPTGGSAGALCAATGITNDPVGTIYSLTTGIAADLLSEQSPAGSEVPSATYAPLLAVPLYIPAGVIRVLVSDHAPGTGAVEWKLIYAPFDSGAEVAAS